MSELAIVATVTSLVSAAISSAKNARDLSKDSSDHELKGAISDLYDALIDIKSRAVDLDEENRSLRQQLLQKDEIVGPMDPHGYFFKKDQLDKPLCPRCYQSQPANVVYLPGPMNWGGGTRRMCLICGFYHMETRQAAQPQFMRPYS